MYVKLNANNSPSKVRKELLKFYKNSKFVKILKLDSSLGSEMY